MLRWVAGGIAAMSGSLVCTPLHLFTLNEKEKYRVILFKSNFFPFHLSSDIYLPDQACARAEIWEPFYFFIFNLPDFQAIHHDKALQDLVSFYILQTPSQE